jgi:hypothetical protein
LSKNRDAVPGLLASICDRWISLEWWMYMRKLRRDLLEQRYLIRVPPVLGSHPNAHSCADPIIDLAICPGEGDLWKEIAI